MPAIKPTKKTAVKKTAKKEARKSASTGFTYSDKSAGQEHLIPIFDSLVQMFQPYVKGVMRLRGGKGGEAALVSEKEVVIEGRKKPEMHFAAALIQKGYVGFHFMPAYMNPAFFAAIENTELKKTLKGKACFHIKKLDAVLEKDIKNAMKIGFDMYKKMGWIG